MAGENPVLYELDVLEARRIADLAADARQVRDALLEEVPDAKLGEPKPARGEHNPASSLVLNGVLAGKPEFVALRQAIVELPSDVREKLWAVMQIGRGNAAIVDWDSVLATGSALSDDDIADRMVSEPDLESCLHKGLYQLGVARPRGNMA